MYSVESFEQLYRRITPWLELEIDAPIGTDSSKDVQARFRRALLNDPREPLIILAATNFHSKVLARVPVEKQPDVTAQLESFYRSRKCVLEASQVARMAAPHQKAAREIPMENGDPIKGYVKRTGVMNGIDPSWSVDAPSYTPFEFEHPLFATNKPVWADPTWDNVVKNETAKAQLANRKSHSLETNGPLRFGGDGRPLNPMGRTGIKGRGFLGRWGPNQAADPVVLRVHLANDDGTRKIEFAAIKRSDNDEWAIPGGMVDPGDTVTQTLQREFSEETNSSAGTKYGLLPDDVVDMFAQGGIIFYQGYSDDPRNTDNAWIETTAALFVVYETKPGQFYPDVKLSQLGDGKETKAAKWIDAFDTNNLYASHKTLLKKAVETFFAMEKCVETLTKQTPVSVKKFIEPMMVEDNIEVFEGFFSHFKTKEKKLDENMLRTMHGIMPTFARFLNQSVNGLLPKDGYYKTDEAFLAAYNKFYQERRDLVDNPTYERIPRDLRVELIIRKLQVLRDAFSANIHEIVDAMKKNELCKKCIYTPAWLWIKNGVVSGLLIDHAKKTDMTAMTKLATAFREFYELDVLVEADMRSENIANNDRYMLIGEAMDQFKKLRTAGNLSPTSAAVFVDFLTAAYKRSYTGWGLNTLVLIGEPT